MHILFLPGGVDWSKKDFDTILEYSQDTDEWKQVGSMKEAKRSHAVSVVRFQDYSEYCIDPETNQTQGIGLIVSI